LARIFSLMCSVMASQSVLISCSSCSSCVTYVLILLPSVFHSSPRMSSEKRNIRLSSQEIQQHRTWSRTPPGGRETFPDGADSF
jgi:hypothetical protein